MLEAMLSRQHLHVSASSFVEHLAIWRENNSECRCSRVVCCKDIVIADNNIMAHGSTLPSHHRSVLFFHVEEEDSNDEVDVDDVDSLVLLVPVLLLAVSFLGPDDEDELRRDGPSMK